MEEIKVGLTLKFDENHLPLGASDFDIDPILLVPGVILIRLAVKDLLRYRRHR